MTVSAPSIMDLGGNRALLIPPMIYRDTDGALHNRYALVQLLPAC